MSNKIDDLLSLNQQYAKTMKDLKVSMALQELWPGCFEAGPVTSAWIKNGYGDLKRLRLRRKDGETRDFELEDLPQWLVDHGKEVS